jgi:aspartyl protease family protein
VTTWLALFILALSAMLLVSNDSGVIAGIDSTTFGYVAFFAALLVYLAGGLLSRYGGAAANFVRDAVTWAALGLGLVTLYTYKDDLAPIAARVMGELVPGTAMIVEESAGGVTEVRIRRRLDGHFTATVDVNGKAVSMIVDTGASSIVLRRSLYRPARSPKSRGSRGATGRAQPEPAWHEFLEPTTLL